MNETSEPPLLSLARQEEAVTRRPRDVPKRALVVKSRKSNRLFQVNRLASDLVECLGEFLASKNVINNSERYAKITEDQTSEGRGRVNPQIAIDLRQHSSQSNNNNCQEKNKQNINQCPVEIKVKKFNQIGGKGQAARRKKRDVSQLLGDLLSGRCPESRLCLVGRLLRAPIVLAALFSLSLATSLFILYTLSFHHCQTAGHSDARSGSSTLRARAFLVASGSSSSQREVEQPELSLSNQLAASAEELIAAVPSLARSSTHHINNRHLVTVANSSANNARAGRLFQTECGTYEARAEGNAWVLTGVAYASPPVGSRRWQKPQPIWRDNALCPAHRQHTHLRDARGPRRAPTIPNHCVQFSPFNHRVSGSEDCLHLDIYTPVGGEGGGNNKSVERLPVMVYIHGGFLVFGSSNGPPDVESAASTSDQRADQDRANWMRARPSGQLAAELNVVLVAPNYRLQALGFMALRALAEDNGPDGSEGNYGLWDQLLALEWIRRNIGSFGGDPDNVLLFGPDAASALPLALVSQQQQRPVRQPRVGAEGGDTPPHGAADEEQREAAIDLSVGSDTNAPADGRSPASQLPFRSVWLMNPTIYYELPYELANQHYARLGWSQSACARAGRARDLQLPPSPSPSPPNGLASERSLIACLMNLTGEQIVREYLGRDRASFRLDDENSLPIRSIFPDQFVTLDGELVQDSYPFTRHAGQLDSNRIARYSQARPVSGVNFLVGSTAQAVAYWPCPRNSHAWSWLDFRHYVETSLNSFNQPQASDTFKLASELYGVPSEGFTSSGGGGNKNESSQSPMGTYLTMVSDIRQVCPGHELARSLRQSARVKSVERYVVEWRPSAQLSASLGMTTGDPADAGHSGGGKCPDCAPSAEMKRGPEREAGRTNLQYAFHYWDLLALFGFEFDTQLEPSERDLEFQRHIRAIAKRVAWQGKTTRGITAATGQPVLDQFDVDEMEHKRRECKMWRQTLKHSYAWVS